MTQTDDLLARLREATGGDRELDGLLTEAFYPEIAEPAHRTRTSADQPAWRHPDFGLIRCGHYTDSVDAALALIERVLPGWGWTVIYQPTHCDNGCTYAGLDPSDGSRGPSVVVRDRNAPAVALVIALVEAVKAQQEASR